MKPIVTTIKSSGSGTGYSYYNKWAECGQKATLDEELRVQGLPTSSQNFFTERGIFLHAFLAIHYKGRPFDTTLIRFSDVIYEDALTEADRVFRAYRIDHEPNEFGKVLEIESELYDEEGKPTRWNSEVQTQLEAAVGIAPYTFRPDLIVQLGVREVQRLRPSFANPELLQPGRWLVDHKSGSQQHANLFERRQWSHQYSGYITAWNTAQPKMSVRGLISNEIICVKEPKVLRYAIVMNADNDTARHDYYRGVSEIMSNPILRSWPRSSPEVCFGHGTCKHFVEGTCKLTQLVG